MEDVSTTNKTLQISDEETEKLTTYSAAVHKVVVMVNTGILGLLQLIHQQSSIFETHKAAFLFLCVLVLLYAVLRVREPIDMQLRPGIVPWLVGHTSPLFGALAVLLLVSVVYVMFALVFFLSGFSGSPWWFTTLSNAFMIYSEANKSGPV